MQQKLRMFWPQIFLGDSPPPEFLDLHCKPHPDIDACGKVSWRSAKRARRSSGELNLKMSRLKHKAFRKLPFRAAYNYVLALLKNPQQKC